MKERRKWLPIGAGLVTILYTGGLALVTAGTMKGAATSAVQEETGAKQPQAHTLDIAGRQAVRTTVPPGVDPGVDRKRIPVPDKKRIKVKPLEGEEPDPQDPMAPADKPDRPVPGQGSGKGGLDHRVGYFRPLSIMA